MGDRLLTIKQVCERVPYTAMHIYRLMKLEQFPHRIRVGPNRVAWREADVQSWIDERVKASAAR